MSNGIYVHLHTRQLNTLIQEVLANHVRTVNTVVSNIRAVDFFKTYMMDIRL